MKSGPHGFRFQAISLTPYEAFSYSTAAIGRIEGLGVLRVAILAASGSSHRITVGMPYKIALTHDAERQLQALSVHDQRIVEAAILSRLQDQPTVPTKAIKQLRPNPLAQFELRAGDLRILYNVEEDQVVILIVGLKVGNKLIVEGEEFHGHQDDSTQPPGSGSPKDPE
ncbi:MAG: type II toxin-antitoxin system RelE/ParE family toxin [Planctomycetaceae bacterium]